jgi:ABC-type multidrug transport system permease subunit
MSEVTPPTERQVLYALVAAGFVIVVAVLVLGAAYADLVPTWWTVISGIATVGVGSLGAVRWRDTKFVLLSSILLFLSWTVGTLLLA